MTCPHANGCTLFPLFSMRESLRVWQISYCNAEYTRCQRFQKSESGQHVPAQMLPNGMMLPERKPTHAK